MAVREELESLCRLSSFPVLFPTKLLLLHAQQPSVFAAREPSFFEPNLYLK